VWLAVGVGSVGRGMLFGRQWGDARERWWERRWREVGWCGGWGC